MKDDEKVFTAIHPFNYILHLLNLLTSLISNFKLKIFKLHSLDLFFQKGTIVDFD